MRILITGFRSELIERQPSYYANSGPTDFYTMAPEPYVEVRVEATVTRPGGTLPPGYFVDTLRVEWEVEFTPGPIRGYGVGAARTYEDDTYLVLKARIPASRWAAYSKPQLERGAIEWDRTAQPPSPRPPVSLGTE